MRPSLTRREAQVLELLAAGYRQSEAARRLGVSPHTVSSHVKNVFRKFGVHSTVAAVALALELRLIGRPSRER